MNLITDKIKFYTNIILSGAISFAPVLWYFCQLKIIDQSLFLTISALSILFVGRICLELSLFVEQNIIDKILSCKIREQSHYEKIEQKGNLFYDNWYKYLSLNGNKVANEIIAHLADRLLFLLSTFVASIISFVLLVTIYKLDIYNNLWLFIVLIFYLVFSFIRAIYIAYGLDFYRYYLLKNQKSLIHPLHDGFVHESEVNDEGIKLL